MTYLSLCIGWIDLIQSLTKKVMKFVVNTATEKLQDKNKLEKIKKINLWKKL